MVKKTKHEIGLGCVGVPFRMYTVQHNGESNGKENGKRNGNWHA